MQMNILFVCIFALLQILNKFESNAIKSKLFNIYMYVWNFELHIVHTYYFRMESLKQIKYLHIYNIVY